MSTAGITRSDANDNARAKRQSTLVRMHKRTKRALRRLHDRLDEIETVIQTDGIRIGHLFSYRHEHWAKIRELDDRLGAIEGQRRIPNESMLKVLELVKSGSGEPTSRFRLFGVTQKMLDAAYEKLVRELRTMGYEIPLDQDPSSRAERVGTGPKPSRRQMRRAAERVGERLPFMSVGSGKARSEEERQDDFEAASEAVSLVRENRLRDADPEELARTEAILDQALRDSGIVKPE